MRIVNCGYNFRHRTDFKVERPNGSGDYLLLVLRSPAFFLLENKVCHTDGNAVVIFKKGSPQIYGADNAEFINDWIHFESDPDDIDFFNEIAIPFDSVLELGSVTELSSLIKRIFFEKYSNNVHSKQSCELYLKLIMLKISDYYHANTMKNNSTITELLNAVRNEIYANPQKKWTVNEISEKLSISKSYLQHQYKLLFNTGIKNDVITSRIEYSKYLLFSTDYPIAVISDLCGYENDVHFMRTFKKITGSTPTEYRISSNYSREKVNDSKNYTPFSIKSSST